jgi:hypothetical protein
MTVKVHILEDWNGYRAGSKVVMRESAYYTHKHNGVKLQLVSGRPQPLIIPDEEEEFKSWNIPVINEEE